MPKYINADEIPSLFDEEYKCTRKLIEQGETHLDNLAEGFLEAKQVIFRIPSVDVVEVVRCKDCKYKDNDFTMCCLPDGLEAIYLDSFCSKGERR